MPRENFRFVVNGAGFGSQRLSRTFQPGAVVDWQIDLARNLASTTSGATASGDGINLARVNDDTEATDWASTGRRRRRAVTIDLAGDQPQTVASGQRERHAAAGDHGRPDPGGQNRFTALRSFLMPGLQRDTRRLHPGRAVMPRSSRVGRPRSRVVVSVRWRRRLNLRTFPISPVQATHLRLVVVASQCTGGPLYAGEQDNDPRAATDCATASPLAGQVRIAEIQAFSR